MKKAAFGFCSGFVFTLALNVYLFWASTGWRFDMATRDMYGVLCQGLNTIWWGSAV